MFVHIQDQKNRDLHTHTTLLEDSKTELVQKTFGENKYYKNGAMFFGFWLSMEAVHRVAALKSKNCYVRAGIVGLTTLLAPNIVSNLHWSLQGNDSLKKALDGAPVWEKKYDVPELDKLYFELADENNYEPTLLHHGQ